MTSTSDPSSTPPDPSLATIHRLEWGRLLSLLVSRTRRLDLAEDALAESFARAAERWPATGVPANPGGWLYTTAHRQILARIRSEAVAGRKAPLLAIRPEVTPASDPTDELADDRLNLILLCCHPALPLGARSALALRLVVGTSTEEVARLFLVSTPTMAARLTRAKKKIVAVGIPLAAPVAEELRRRLDEVCRTVYLAFTAGYTPGKGPDLHRADLAGDAVHLAAVLHHLVPEAPAVRALYALVLLQHSRRNARVDDGRLVMLADQDRTRWHHDEIRTGLALVGILARSSGFADELRLQAHIAAEHARANTAEDTDWHAIAGYYAELEALTGSPVVRLNRAVAVAEVHGPAAGLALLADLEHELTDSHRLAAVVGELARRVGDTALATASLQAAIELCANDVERDHIRSQLARLEADTTPSSR